MKPVARALPSLALQTLTAYTLYFWVGAWCMQSFGPDSVAVGISHFLGVAMAILAFIDLILVGGVEAFLYLVALPFFVGSLRHATPFMASWWGGVVGTLTGLYVVPLTIGVVLTGLKIVWEAAIERPRLDAEPLPIDKGDH